jgi:hypothetical protein
MKYAIIKNCTVVRIVECESINDLQLKNGEIPHATKGNIQNGDRIFLNGTPFFSEEKKSVFPRPLVVSFIFLTIGAALVIFFIRG